MWFQSYQLNRLNKCFFSRVLLRECKDLNVFSTVKKCINQLITLLNRKINISTPKKERYA